MNRQIDLTQRIAKSSTEAAAGYATAAMAAYVDFSGQVMAFWANTIQSMVPEPEPRSWYRHPDAPGRSQSYGNGAYANGAMGLFGFTPMNTANFAMPGGAGAGIANSLLDPFNFWAKVWPLQGNPAAWPMAFMMMGMGMPRTVAYPLAQANTAAMEAVNTTTRAAKETFSSYRSDSGYASAQIRFQPSTAIAALMMPLGLYALAPWLSIFASMPRTY